MKITSSMRRAAEHGEGSGCRNEKAAARIHNRDDTMPRMPPHALDLILLPGRSGVGKLPAGALIPRWATSGSLFSITRTADELSILCEESLVPQGVTCERQWKC